MSMTKIGEVDSKKQTRILQHLYEDIHAEWKIPDFFSVSEYNDSKFYDSPAFSVAGVSFFFRMYPRNSNHSNSVCFYLKNDVIRNFSVEYNFGVKKLDGSMKQLQDGIMKGGDTYCEKPVDVLTSELLCQKSDLLPENVLTLTCTLKPDVIHSTMADELDNPKELKLKKLDTLSKNFKDLKANKESCDTTLHVQDKEYKAHRAVLMARSPVFAAMFLHETSEKQTGIVTISDCDPDSFDDFLEFLYSGKFEEPSPRSALYLYETSDKYEVQELKTFCVEYLMENLSVENVCGVAILADKYEEADLLSAAQDFFNKNLGEIFDTSEWDSLVKNNYCLSKTLLKKMSSKVKVID